MKTFKDLEPKAKTYGSGTQARMDFPNGYGVSVITGEGSYSSTGKPFEVAVMFNGLLTYDTNITDDVLGHQTKEQVTEIMKQIQGLK